MKRKVTLAIFVLFVLLVATGGVAFLWLRSGLEASAAEYQAQIEASQKAYLARLEEWLDRPDDPRETFDVQVFLSAGILENIGLALQGQTLHLGDGRTLAIERLNFRLSRGFPLVELNGSYHDRKSGISFGGEIAAVLELASDQKAVTLNIRPISVKPVFGFGTARLALSGLLGNVSQEIARNYADAWPGLELPVQTELPLRIPPVSTEAVLKIGKEAGDPWVKVRIDFPQLAADLKLVYRGILFTETGIQLYADLLRAGETGGNPQNPSPAWEQMNTDQRLEALGFGDSDLGARVAKRLFVFAVQEINAQPAEEKVVRFQGLERFGNLVSGKFGPAYYDVWLHDPTAARGSTQLRNLSATIATQPNEIIRYRALGVASGEGQLGVRASLGKPKVDDRGQQATDRPISVEFAPTEFGVSGFLVLTKDGDLPIIAIMVDETDEIQAACRIELPVIGSVRIEPRFRVPATRMTRIKLPPSIDHAGELQLGKERKPYAFTIRELRCRDSGNYLTLDARATLSLR